MNDAGYIHCSCRDCFETTIGPPGTFCDECVNAGCNQAPEEHECLRPDAYGAAGDLPLCGGCGGPITPVRAGNEFVYVCDCE